MIRFLEILEIILNEIFRGILLIAGMILILRSQVTEGILCFILVELNEINKKLNK